MMKLISQLRNLGKSSTSWCASSAALAWSFSAGTFSSSTSSVTMIANTPSLNASIRVRRSRPCLKRPSKLMESSIDLGAGSLHHLGPFRNLRFQVAAQLLGRAADHVDAEIGQGLAHGRIVHGRGGRAMERGDHVF